MATVSAATVWRDLRLIRKNSPLVHNITNYVVMNSTANALLALGASPVMAHAPEEVEEMTGLASALVINIGTLSRAWVESMFLAAAAANKKGIPVVFDPVGAGATRLRTDTARRFLKEIRPAVVRANASEVRALASTERATKGVDSRHGAAEAVEAGRSIVREFGCVVSISGAVDIIIGPENDCLQVENGHPLMPRVTGMGCAATALTGAFAAVSGSPFGAAAGAMVVMGIAGELAALKAEGPGSFQPAFLDALFRLGRNDIEERIKVRLSEEPPGPGRSPVRRGRRTK